MQTLDWYLEISYICIVKNIWNMLRILNNKKEMVRYADNDEAGARKAFDLIAGRSVFGTLYQMYLEQLAVSHGLENGTVELVNDNGTMDKAELIEFADGKRMVKSANVLPSNYERKPRRRARR